MPSPQRVANQVSLSSEFVQQVAKQLEHIDNHDHLRSPDSIRFQQDGDEGWVQFEHKVAESDGGDDDGC